MNTISFIITAVMLVVLAAVYGWYADYYVQYNMVNTVNYVNSLVAGALVQEFQNAVSLASMSQVVGNFNYTLMLPTSAIHGEGISLNYYIIISSTKGSPKLVTAEVITEMQTSSVREARLLNITLYSAGQPFSIYAYNCINSNAEVNITNGGTCIWSSAEVQEMKAVIEISKG